MATPHPLAAYLARHGISRKQFGQQIGVTGGAVSHWITGRYDPSPELALKVERATRGEVTRQELLPELAKLMGAA